ncbi:MAG: hypothetical protein DWQ08_08175, partial [Proteobacteria bacterium]
DDPVFAAGSVRADAFDECDFIIARMLRNGEPPASFSGVSANGVLWLYGQDPCYANAIDIQPDGKIVVAGVNGNPATTSRDVTLVRLNPDGTPDPAFGSGGIVQTDILGRSLDDTARDVKAVKHRGSIRIVVGGHRGAPPDRDVVLIAYREDGTLDSSFGANRNGVVVLDYGSGGAKSDDIAAAISVDENGLVRVFGTSTTDGDSNIAWTELDAEGTVLRQQEIELRGSQDAPSIDIAPGGETLLAFRSEHAIAVARMTAGGAIDLDFGEKGFAYPAWENLGAAPSGIVDPGDGGIFVAFNSQQTALVGKLDPSGAVDSDFGEDGVAAAFVESQSPGIPSETYLHALASQRDGRIVGVGQQFDVPQLGFKSLIVRFESMIRNMGFETDDDANDFPDAWEAISARDIDRRVCGSALPGLPPTDAYAGRCYFRLQGDSSNAARGLEQRIALTGSAGDRIELVLSRRATNSAPNEMADASVAIRYGSGWDRHRMDIRTTTGSWETKHLTFVAAQDYSELVVQPVLRSYTYPNSEFDIDQVVLLVDPVR